MTANQKHSTGAPLPGRYEIDTSRSVITFAGRHLFGLLPVRGSFRIRNGTVDVAAEAPGSAVRVEVDAESFHTGNERRDTDVRSARFLDTGRFPLLSFESELVGETTVTGALTACGTTRRIVLSVGELDALRDTFTARATARVDRTEFGVTAARGLAGRHLNLMLEIRAVRETTHA
ncbi:YceI family protein [Amycolatopsis palatopharyngis]|uniref:YceI family protein n=1 Tax=Amycolatopsis palatopharyngis TaxID=187982 RepID=UPI000E284756|nr:YceI family protein [Amycolatopsis palatopharyngis]